MFIFQEFWNNRRMKLSLITTYEGRYDMKNDMTRIGFKYFKPFEKETNAK